MIEIKNIKKSYEKTSHQVLNDISLCIQEHEFVTLGGVSGSGKSTLLRILALIDVHFEGTYQYKGSVVLQDDVETINLFRRDILGIIFQDFNLIARYTVYRNLEFALITQKIPHKERKRKMIRALKRVNLSETLLMRKPSALSGGQKQRVAIARALLSNPKLIVADEPTGSLDDENAQEIIELFKSLNITCIIATHDKRIAKDSDRHIHVEKGKIYVTERLL